MKTVTKGIALVAMCVMMGISIPVAAQTTDNTTNSTATRNDDRDDTGKWGLAGLLGLLGLLGLRKKDVVNRTGTTNLNR